MTKHSPERSFCLQTSQRGVASKFDENRLPSYSRAVGAQISAVRRAGPSRTGAAGIMERRGDVASLAARAEALRH